jgi:hypothetical protein
MFYDAPILLLRRLRPDEIFGRHSGECSEAALREHLDAMVQTNKGKPIRDVTIKQSFER